MNITPISFLEFKDHITEIQNRFNELDNAEDAEFDGIYNACLILGNYFGDTENIIWQWFIDLEPYDIADLYTELVKTYSGDI